MRHALLSGLLLTGASGCARHTDDGTNKQVLCEDTGCSFEGVAYFDFSERREAWRSEQSASYEFTVRFDGADHTCSGVVEDDMTCDSSLLKGRSFSSASGDERYVGVSALWLTVYPGPATLHIERDGATVFDKEYKIVERDEFPNGPDCGSCTGWTTEVTW